MAAGWELGVDVGGTFTDVVAFHPAERALRTAKVPSQTDYPIAGLLAALSAVELAWEEVATLVHATTLVTNAIVEDKLADSALISTEGFSDTLAIGRQNRRYLYRLDLPPKVTPSVPEERRFEVRERMDASGAVLVELDDESIDAAVRKVQASGVKAVAVSLIRR